MLFIAIDIGRDTLRELTADIWQYDTQNLKVTETNAVSFLLNT